MPTIQFNTGRRYSVHGQRVTALLENGVCYFRDHDRMIGGEFRIQPGLEDDLFNQSYVMERYDAGAYHMSSRALAADLAWKD